MKQFFFFLLAIVSINAVSQSAKFAIPLSLEDPEMDAYLSMRKIPVLTVKVINNPSPEKKINITYTLASFWANVLTEHTAQLNNEGEAKIVLEKNLPYQQLWLNIDGYLFTDVYVNTSLTVIIDAGKTSTTAFKIGDGVYFEGADGELNRVMAEKNLYRTKEYNDLTQLLQRISFENYINISAGSEVKFRLRADSIYRELNNINEAFLVKYPQYEWAVKNEMQSDFYAQICNSYGFSSFSDSMAIKIYAHKPYFTSSNGVFFYRYLNDYIARKFGDNKRFPYEEINRNYFDYTAAQKSILDSIGQFEKMDEAAKKKNEQLIEAVYKNGDRLFYAELKLLGVHNGIKAIEKVVSISKADILKLTLLENGKDGFKTAYPEILKHTKFDWCRRVIKDEQTVLIFEEQEMAALLADSKKIEASVFFIGTPLQRLSFGAELYKLDSVKNVDDFIAALKSKFKNKALIIDFWGTWCGPCIQDMPRSKKLHEDNKDLPIEFIYLCTNGKSNEILWKKRIIGEKLAGTHIFVENSIMNDLKKKLDTVNGYPSYVVIDIKGQTHSKDILTLVGLDNDKIRQVAGL